MKKKLLFMLITVALMVCALAVSVSATTYYYDEDGDGNESMFQCEYGEREIITSYSGAFPTTNANGECISWYATNTESKENGDIYITVKSFVTVDENYCTVDSKGVYRFKNGPTKRNIVSINFPNDHGLTSFVDEGAYGFYAQTGDYLPSRTELLFAYFPNTWQDSERLVQATTVLEVYIHPDAPFRWLAANDQGEAIVSNVAFHDCCSLRKVELPHTIQKFRDGGNGCVFRRCYNLKSIDLSNLTNLYHIGSHTFYESGIEELVIPASVTVIEDRAFEGMKSLKKIWLGANTEKMIGQSMLYQTNNIQYIYMSNTLVEASGSHIFPSEGDVRSVIFFVGSLSDLERVKAVIGTNNQGRINHTNYLEWDPSISDDEYVQKATNDKKNYIVYGYSRCEAFFGGHKMSENTEMMLESYFAPIRFASVCVNNGCDHAGYDESKTIDALFVDYGYSATEAPINGAYSMSQFYGINKDAIEQYRALSAEFEFGFVVSTVADPFGEVENGTLTLDKFFVADEEFFAYDYASISVGGISEDKLGAEITFCMFVRDGAKVFYLDDGKTVGAATVKSYNDVLAMKNA